MFHTTSWSRFRILVAVLAACLALTACGGDDSSEAESDDSADTAADTSSESADDSEGDDTEGDDSEGDDSDEEAGTAAGTITIDGTTYSFSPTICFPDESAGSSISGAGSGDDGTDMYVDMAGGTLSVYVGTDDPFAGDPDYVASPVAGQGSLDESVDGSTVSVEASFTGHEDTNVIAEGSLEATC